jgi:hypothetical protein
MMVVQNILLVHSSIGIVSYARLPCLKSDKFVLSFQKRNLMSVHFSLVTAVFFRRRRLERTLQKKVLLEEKSQKQRHAS